MPATIATRYVWVRKAGQAELLPQHGSHCISAAGRLVVKLMVRSVNISNAVTCASFYADMPYEERCLQALWLTACPAAACAADVSMR
jgi:hypothetical protein